MKTLIRVFWLYHFGATRDGVWFASGLYQTNHGVTACVDCRYFYEATLGMDGVE